MLSFKLITIIFSYLYLVCDGEGCNTPAWNILPKSVNIRKLLNGNDNAPNVVKKLCQDCINKYVVSKAFCSICYKLYNDKINDDTRAIGDGSADNTPISKSIQNSCNSNSEAADMLVTEKMMVCSMSYN